MNDVFIDGYFIPKGTEIMPQYGCILHDPNLFPNPDQFLPERFLDTDGAYRPRVELKPFGFGARVCLGEFLAKCELYLIFTTLLQKFTFTAIDNAGMFLVHIRFIKSRVLENILPTSMLMSLKMRIIKKKEWGMMCQMR
ncbi:hypothetical protein ANCCEY_11248 [Ancylostoma ceylanicum]|uniref:Unspecific monooxygenase n=1 Tax=Ancylostoma ceylanicum TaxID=53326 RepID=A0A0D6LPS0_9BILA|nr:hypothetical protein ANCCEY_11248 [Ancylostoma ceylanicum]